MNKDREKLTVVLITKDEEGKIARCLESVKWADEIIVVDDFSTDNTIELAKKYTDKVIQHKSNGFLNYRQRNMGIDRTTGDWILQMDADEIVTNKAKKEIEKILAKKSEFVAYKFRRENFFLGHFMRYGGLYCYFLPFFKRGCGRYKKQKQHAPLEIKGKVGTVEAEIKHYPYENISQYLERQNLYTSGEAEDIFTERGLVNKKEFFYHLLIKPIKLIWKTYIKKRGYKDGLYGLAYSLLSAWGYFLRWVKYWELLQNRNDSAN